MVQGKSVKRKVVHLITGLGKGGAETMLYQIIKYRTHNAPDYVVVSLGLSHYYEKLIRDYGIDIIELDIRRHPFSSSRRLKNVLRDTDVLCCWMYISNLVGYVFGRRKVSKLIWCIRHSNLDKRLNSRKTLVINRVCAWLSHKVDVVAYNGYRAMNVHRGTGYNPKSDCVVDNGLDLAEYIYDPELKQKLRDELNLSGDDKVILTVTKNHPIKDVPAFIRAFALLKNLRSDVKAVACGSGMTEDNADIKELCEQNNLTTGKDILFLGFRNDVNRIMNLGDVYVLHSAGEAFPNTLIQAMACEIPVVSTDVGDVRNILDNSEYIVEVGDYKAIADRVDDVLNMSDFQIMDMRKSGRNIVETKYNIFNVVKTYEELFKC